MYYSNAKIVIDANGPMPVEVVVIVLILVKKVFPPVPENPAVAVASAADAASAEVVIAVAKHSRNNSLNHCRNLTCRFLPELALTFNLFLLDYQVLGGREKREDRPIALPRKEQKFRRRILLCDG